ncbi:aminomethyltransferase, tetrahydrofolate-dependent, subunit (T protein) of glycine cleavage complex [Georgfuchsia toluolica]|uniref:Aminomethyltransferase n=1 Tax=Georgfuchsia toluolica TaxID=424218 RepID=A0A916N1T1_9PROT|nr:glycine cleavage system aminomethyltransferase GcvT [Georgfuchsia toluolica]CAG4883014.1 aminomethyltransferase, tetrahydrofolate-dependent, subunit (T protein) of glycine cleavage complex [Georgfuchsia toluolica]
MAQRTPLYDTHVAAHAKIVDFAGWEMPIHYGSQIEEHHTVRGDAGMFDVSHMLAIDLAGKDAQRWLRRLLANDVAKLARPGKALYSCMLREDGGVIDDLIVYFFTPQRYRIVVNAGTADKDLAWMRKQLAGFDATLTPRRDLAMIAVQGPHAREKFWAAFPTSRAASEGLQVFQAADWRDWLIARTGYTGEDGFEISLPAAVAAQTWQALAAAGVAPIGLGARDTLRLEAGMNLYGQDMDESVGPLESGLAWTVDFKDAGRDFIGRKTLEAQKPARKLVGLLLLDRGVLRSHQKVITAQGNGETTSGSFSPTLNQSIALARVPVDVAIGDEVSVEIRDKKLKAKVVKPNFARHGKSLL